MRGSGVTEQRTTIDLAGASVPRIGFGGLHLAGPHGWGAPADREAAETLLRSAIDAGVRYLDTADTLGPGASEDVIGSVLAADARDDLVVATKAGMTRTAAGASGWGVLGHPAYLKQQAHASRIRLRVDRIPLFYLHRIDPAYALEDQLGALVELRDDGVIGGVGVSGVTPDQLRAAQAITPIAAVQNHLSVIDRRGDAVLAVSREIGIPFVAFWTLGRGAAVLEHPVVRDVASREGVSPAVVAIAWLLQHDPTIIALPGTSSPARITANVTALQHRLAPRSVAELDAIGAP